MSATSEPFEAAHGETSAGWDRPPRPRRARGTRTGLAAGLLSLLLGALPYAEGTPSFEMVVSTGGVTRLAVGETLQLRAFFPPPTCLPSASREPKKPLAPLTIPLTWTVAPADAARAAKDGLLTALKPAWLQIHVERATSKGETPNPGEGTLSIVEVLPEGRLPHLDGGVSLERFHLAWDPEPKRARELQGQPDRPWLRVERMALPGGDTRARTSLDARGDPRAVGLRG